MTNNILKISPPWENYLTPQQSAILLSSSTLINFHKGETIIKQGFAASHILYLQEGLVKLSLEEQEKTVVFKIISSGSFIGLMCSFVKRNFDFTATAIEECTVRMIERSFFEQMIRANGNFAVHVVELMSFMTNKIVHDLVYIHNKNADGAISTILLELSNIFQSNDFQMPFSRVELADTLGYSKESVISSLSTLQKDGIIKVSGKKIKILNTERLQLVAQYG